MTEQLRQEQVSRSQLAERIRQYDWTVDDIVVDLGEDFFVRIYDKGVWSGLSFLIQLKSTTDLERHKIREGWFSYSLEVKDLVHWEGSSIPILIMLWDVETKAGVWSSVEAAVADLDKLRPRWRQQRTVRVRLPQGNTIDEAGFRLIRRIVAEYSYPSIAQGKPLQLKTKFVFPPTEEGNAARKALERHFAAGDPVEINGRFIEELEFSGWWKRLFGSVDVSKGFLALGPSKSERSVPVRIDVTSPEGGIATLPYVQLRVTKSGSDEATLANDLQVTPIGVQCILTHSRREVAFSFQVLGPGAHVEESRDVLSFLSACAEGGTLRMTVLSGGRPLDIDFPRGLMRAPSQDLVTAVDKLCAIQRSTGCTLSLGPNWELSGPDVQAIHRLLQIIETGRCTLQDATATYAMQKPAIDLILDLLRARQPVKLQMVGDDCWEELLGVRIDLGPYRFWVCGVPSVPTADLEMLAAEMDPEDQLEITLSGAEVIQEFLNWSEQTAAPFTIYPASEDTAHED